MPDLIDRDTLLYALDKLETIDGQPRAIRRARKRIAEIPSVDAVVVKSAFITEKDTCSNCGCQIPTDSALDAIFRNEVHFCYSCGASFVPDVPIEYYENGGV